MWPVYKTLGKCSFYKVCRGFLVFGSCFPKAPLQPEGEAGPGGGFVCWHCRLGAFRVLRDSEQVRRNLECTSTLRDAFMGYGFISEVPEQKSIN